jgi:agmatinase
MMVQDFNVAGLQPWAGLPHQQPGADADFRIYGVPIDRGSTYRPGAAQAPADLRRLSAIFAPVTERAEHFAHLTVEDCGDVPVIPGDMGMNLEAASERIGSTPAGVIPVVLGGDHTTVVPTLIAQQRRHDGQLAVLYIDAHPDLNDVSRQSRWSNGCSLRRALELTDIDPRNVVLLGCRDYDWDEVEYIRKMGVKLITSAQAHRMEPKRLRETLESVTGSGFLHISLDIDVLDPGFAPGTGIPAAGGLTSRQILDFLYALRGMKLAGIDVDEVSPPLDVAHVTSLAALKFVFEFIASAKLKPA